MATVAGCYGKMEIAVIADDLTGANANGALLTARGFTSATCLDPAGWAGEAFAQYRAIAVTADSRLVPPAEARERVAAAVRFFARGRPALISKRIDSTLRGNVGAEIEGALLALDETEGRGKTVALVVAAHPASGRIVSGGYLVVHGLPLERSPIARDAATPVRHTSVLDIIAEQSDWPVGFIDLKAVLQGPDRIREEALGHWRSGRRILAFDAVTEDDIAQIAAAFKEAPFPVLAVDPGPFTAHLAAARRPSSGLGTRVLLVIGSTSELTRRQVEALRLARPTHLVRVDPRAILAEDLREAEMDRALKELLAAPAEVRVLGFLTAEKAGDILALDKLAPTLGLLPGAVSNNLNSALAALAEKALAQPELGLGGLYTSGGEVTAATLRRLGAQGFSVSGQVIPLATFGRLLGGARAGLPMITKGGFVGDAGSLLDCLAHLFAKISEDRGIPARGDEPRITAV